MLERSSHQWLHSRLCHCDICILTACHGFGCLHSGSGNIGAGFTSKEEYFYKGFILSYTRLQHFIYKYFSEHFSMWISKIKVNRIFIWNWKIAISSHCNISLSCKKCYIFSLLECMLKITREACGCQPYFYPCKLICKQQQ